MKTNSMAIRTAIVAAATMFFLQVFAKPPIIEMSEDAGYLRFMYLDSTYALYNPNHIDFIRSVEGDTMRIEMTLPSGNRNYEIVGIRIGDLGAPIVPNADSLINWFKLTFTP